MSETTNVAVHREDEKSAWIVKAVAWYLVFLASLLNLLNFNHYPIIRVEVGLLIGALALVSGLLALIERAAPRLAFAFTACLVLVGVDLNTQNTWLPPLLAAAALLSAWFNNGATVKIVMAAFGTVCLFQLGTALTAVPSSPALAPAPDVSQDQDRPAVIHLLMDSYVGTEGMRAEPALRDLHDETAEFFGERGFRLYDGAYTRHANTANSVPYALSFGTTEPPQQSQLDVRAVPNKLAYFQTLAENGYKISILGADYIDLCSGQPITDCRQFAHSDLSALTKFPLSTRDRAITIALTLVSFGNVTSVAFDLWQFASAIVRGDELLQLRSLKKVGSLPSAIAMTQLVETFANIESGHAYFVHLLVPHEPYVFDENCEIRPRADWSTEWSSGTRVQRLADYGAQLSCTNRLLGKILDNVDASPAGRDAIVIIHGDHGARIAEHRPTMESSNLSPEDFAITYSTLFAVRAPGISPGTIPGRASLDELLKDFASGKFATAPSAGTRPAEVILATWDWVPKDRIPLPEYGAR